MTLAERRFTAYVRPHFKWLLLALVCMAANALATGFYAYLVGPVVKFLFAGGLAEDDSLTHLLAAIGFAPRLEDRRYLLTVLPALVLAAALVKGLSQFGKFYLMGMLGERSVFDLRAEVVAKVHRLTLSRLESASTGDILARLTSGVALVQEAITNALTVLISDSLKIAVLLGLAIALDWRLAMTTVVALPLVMLPIVWLSRRLKATAARRQECVAGVMAHAGEDLNAIRAIKELGLAGERRTRFASVNRAYFDASMASYGVRALASPLMEWLGALGLAATLALAGWWMNRGTLVPEHFISFFAAILMLYEPLKDMGRLNAVVQAGRAGAEQVMDLLGWEEERHEGRDLAIDTLRRAVEIDSVVFAYGDRPALDGVTLTIRAGETLALVGPSGAGKTTLARLLLGHYEPAAGDIRFDGVSIRRLRYDSLRRLVTLVEQRPVLFDESLAANVRLARPDATEEELERALGDAQLAEFVAALPDGGRTRVGEGGEKLSEGQRQRVALARAFLRRTPVVVLDEVTAPLDAANEAAILAAIRRLREEGRTVVLIAHRLSTVREADRIAVLDRGRAVEEGTHRELLERAGLYRRFLDLQNGDSRPAGVV